MTNWAQIFTVFCYFVQMMRHQVWRLVLESYQKVSSVFKGRERELSRKQLKSSYTLSCVGDVLPTQVERYPAMLCPKSATDKSVTNQAVALHPNEPASLAWDCSYIVVFLGSEAQLGFGIRETFTPVVGLLLGLPNLNESRMKPTTLSTALYRSLPSTFFCNYFE